TTVTFDPSKAVDDSSGKETLTLNGAEELQTGDAVIYRKGDAANTVVGGLTDGGTYYAIVQSDGSLKLATTRANAVAGTAIDLTSAGTGSDHRLVFDRAHTFGAQAMSGASGGDTGVAGSLALNIAVSEARAAIADNATVTITDSGSVSLVAENFVVNGAESKASQTDAAKTGVGASIALNIGVNHTDATLGNEAVVSGAHDFKLSAASSDAMTTHAEGGSAGATAVTPVLAIAISDDHTNATLGSLASVAGGENKAATAKDKNDQKGGVNNDVHNASTYGDDRGAKSGASTKSSSKTDGKATGDTADGSVQVAGALGVTVAVTEAHATIADGLTVKSGGVLTLKAQNNTDAAASADGSAKTDKTGTGVLTITGGKDVELKAQNFVTNTVTAKAQQEGAKSFGMGASIAVNVGVTGTDAIIGDGAALDDAHNVTLSASSSNQMLTRAEGGAKGDTAISPVVAVAVSTDDTNA